MILRAPIIPDYRGPTFAERVRLNTIAMMDRQAAEHRAAILALDDTEARDAAPVHGRMLDSELRAMADRRVRLMRRKIDRIEAAMTPAGTLAWINGHVEPLQGRAFAFEGERPEGDQLRGILARAVCSMFWRRQLRRAAVRHRETEGNARGEVCAVKRTPYVTHDTAHRHAERRRANQAMLEATELENEHGQCFTLAALAEKSVTNKAIRRGELMTRIAGCEALSQGLGLRGVFLTLTAPSRFHRMLKAGPPNPAHDGSTPRDAHLWLCATWAKARAKLARAGVQFAGFRVAEPHHDGCPHWHALLWVKPGELWRLVLTLRRWWLKDAGDEPGARQHRVKAVLMEHGGAAGYMAKYVAKNIDDAGAIGTEGHKDDGGEAGPAQGDMLGGGTAQRVEAWASAWGIRQFQAIGQPPVTVWRELRRVPVENQGGCTARLGAAFNAANRDGDKRASWARYLLAQGGFWVGRAYPVRVARQDRMKHGRYDSAELPMPMGVYDTATPGDWHLSTRCEWKSRGEWTREQRAPLRGPLAPVRAAEVARCLPWTRVNNCTRASRQGGPAALLEAGLIGVQRLERARLFRNRGGGSLQTDPATCDNSLKSSQT